jgi:hypothetical protein
MPSLMSFIRAAATLGDLLSTAIYLMRMNFNKEEAKNYKYGEKIMPLKSK